MCPFQPRATEERPLREQLHQDMELAKSPLCYLFKMVSVKHATNKALLNNPTLKALVEENMGLSAKGSPLGMLVTLIFQAYHPCF